jgi:hypothetical protein
MSDDHEFEVFYALKASRRLYAVSALVAAFIVVAIIIVARY